jgi:hypothetical protein
VDVRILREAISQIVGGLKKEISAYYQTECKGCGELAEFSYAIWSDLADCPECGDEHVVWDVAVNKSNGEVLSSFICPSCRSPLTKGNLIRKHPVPVRIIYKCPHERSKRAREDQASQADVDLASHPDYERHLKHPRNENMMHTFPGSPWGEQWRSGYHKEVVRVADFFTKRNYHALSVLWEKIQSIDDTSVRDSLKFAFTGTLVGTSRMIKYIPSRGGRSNLPATLYIPPIFLEQNVRFVFERRSAKILQLKKHLDSLYAQRTFVGDEPPRVSIKTVDAQDLSFVPSDHVDYFIIDPPFGENIQYAELNFIPESWLGVHTDVQKEAVINRFRKHGSDRYLRIMLRSFQELYRVLKPHRFGTVIFNNSSPDLWVGIKRSIMEAGFAIESVTAMVKGHGGWNQVVHSMYTTRYDPMIHVSKPTHPHTGSKLTILEDKAQIQEMVRNIVRHHLHKLPSASSRYLSSIAYVHGLVVRNFLGAPEIITPPSPRDLCMIVSDFCEVTNDGLLRLSKS